MAWKLCGVQLVQLCIASVIGIQEQKPVNLASVRLTGLPGQLHETDR